MLAEVLPKQASLTSPRRRVRRNCGGDYAPKAARKLIHIGRAGPQDLVTSERVMARDWRDASPGPQQAQVTTRPSTNWSQRL